MHERDGAQRRFTDWASVRLKLHPVPNRVGVLGRELHEEIVRVLAVDQSRDAVRRLAGGEKKRIAAAAHERVGAQHRPELQHVPIGEVAAGGAYRHARDKGHFVAARSLLPVVDGVEGQMAHQHPIAGNGMKAAMDRRVGLPGGAGRFAGRGIGAEGAGHCHRPRFASLGRRVRRIVDRHLVLGMVDRSLMLGMVGRRQVGRRWWRERLGRLSRIMLTMAFMLGVGGYWRRQGHGRDSAETQQAHRALRSSSSISSPALRRCSTASPPVIAASMQ